VDRPTAKAVAGPFKTIADESSLLGADSRYRPPVASPRILLLEPDAQRAATLARTFEQLRMPVETSATAAGLAEAASVTESYVVAVSGLGGGGAARVRALREDARTAALVIVAIVPPGPAAVAALKAGADDVLSWPAPEALVRARFRTVLAVARSRDESRKTAAAFAGILGAVEAREPHRIEHSARVGRLGADLARRAGLSVAEIERIRVGGILHDFGTVAIPDGILFKREPLTESEFAVMKSHPVIGFTLLREVPALEPYLPFVLRHHERIDGSGYPDGLRGTELPLPVQLVSIADAFDAMTSSRPYRSVRDDISTIQVLEEEAARGRWDPALLSLLVAATTDRDEPGSPD
jgi:putative two-component system response regulator